MKTLEKSSRTIRASFTCRLTAHTVDLAICGLLTAALPGNGALRCLAAAVWIYYLFWDFFAGRTPGKMFFGLRYVTRAGQPAAKGALLLRSFYRLLGPLLILSWRRCSLLDLMSGTGVGWVNRDADASPSRRTRPIAR